MEKYFEVNVRLLVRDIRTRTLLLNEENEIDLFSNLCKIVDVTVENTY